MNTTVTKILSGNVNLFNDFESDGIMWSGEGNRSAHTDIKFEIQFVSPPKILTSISLMDASTANFLRYSLNTENVSVDGFTVKFSTWLDTKFARIWVEWIAIGEYRDPNDWFDL